ncbi:MAG: hypothetical protein ACOYK1_02600 [Vampirovibrionia bacterium]
MNIHKQHAMLRMKKNLVDAEKDPKRYSSARYFENILLSNSSDDKYAEYILKDAIERSYFFLDFDFIKEALVTLFRKTKSDSIKEHITALYNGTLDVSSIEKQIKLCQEIEEASEAAELATEKFINEYLGIN